jgi:hypothetical protein
MPSLVASDTDLSISASRTVSATFSVGGLAGSQHGSLRRRRGSGRNSVLMDSSYNNPSIYIN